MKKIIILENTLPLAEVASKYKGIEVMVAQTVHDALKIKDADGYLTEPFVKSGFKDEYERLKALFNVSDHCGTPIKEVLMGNRNRPVSEYFQMIKTKEREIEFPGAHFLIEAKKPIVYGYHGYEEGVHTFVSNRSIFHKDKIEYWREVGYIDILNHPITKTSVRTPVQVAESAFGRLLRMVCEEDVGWNGRKYKTTDAEHLDHLLELKKHGEELLGVNPYKILGFKRGERFRIDIPESRHHFGWPIYPARSSIMDKYQRECLD